MKIKLTPDYAAELLSANTKNRPVAKKRVSVLAKAMTSGEWVYNGESIKVANTGVLIDGQHRLEAVIESEVSIDTEILTGLDESVFDTIDSGKSRTFADVFAVNGVVNYGPVSGIVYQYDLLLRKTPSRLGWGSTYSRRNHYLLYKERQAVIDSVNVNHKIIGGKPIIVFACNAYLSHFNDNDFVNQFFYELHSGVFSMELDQTRILRERFIRMAADRKTTVTSVEQAALILKAFKNIKSGLNPTRISAKSYTNFPYDSSHVSPIITKIGA